MLHLCIIINRDFSRTRRLPSFTIGTIRRKGGWRAPRDASIAPTAYDNHRLTADWEGAMMKETTAATVASKSCKRDAEMVADGMSDTADRRKPTAGCRRRTGAAVASSSSGQSRTAVTVLSVVMVACAVAAVDLQHAAAACQHWLSTMFQSAADQQVCITDQCIIRINKYIIKRLRYLKNCKKQIWNRCVGDKNKNHKYWNIIQKKYNLHRHRISYIVIIYSYTYTVFTIV